MNVPKSGVPLIAGLDTGAIPGVPRVDFMNDIPNVRFYVEGPNRDGIAENAHVGNYWFKSDTFPIVSPYITNKKMYMHNNGTLDYTAPSTDEGYKIYVHDPNDPILTIGGENMVENLPAGEPLMIPIGRHGQSGHLRKKRYSK